MGSKMIRRSFYTQVTGTVHSVVDDFCHFSNVHTYIRLLGEEGINERYQWIAPPFLHNMTSSPTTRTLYSPMSGWRRRTYFKMKMA